MKLFWGEHTCAIGIHILLEEIGRPYETERIDVGGGATHQPAFLAINPKGKVPTLLRDDGSVLTEFTAIAAWLALRNPDKGLLPMDPGRAARALEVMAYVEGTIHGQGYGRIFAPQAFEAQDLLHRAVDLGRPSVQHQGREIVERGFALLDAQVGRDAYAVGPELTIADAALFYVERWAPTSGITLPTNMQRHLETMEARPAVHKVRKLWGEI